MNYLLIKTIKKNGTFVYTITDTTGKIYQTRESKREYVAATIDGSYFFGRLDLIGKAGHKANIAFQLREGREVTPIAYVQNS